MSPPLYLKEKTVKRLQKHAKIKSKALHHCLELIRLTEIGMEESFNRDNYLTYESLQRKYLQLFREIKDV